MWNSRAEAEAGPPSVTTAGPVIAQNAGLAHGVAWVIAPTAGPRGWDAICCSQLVGVARWTWSQSSGRPTGNIWPLSSSAATSLTRESFMRVREYTTWCRWRCQRGRCWPSPPSRRPAPRGTPRPRPGGTSSRRFFSPRSPDLRLAPAALLGQPRGLVFLDRRRVLRRAALGRDSPGRRYRKPDPQYVPKIELRAKQLGKAYLLVEDLHDRLHCPMHHDFTLSEWRLPGAVERLLQHAPAQRARHGIRQQRRIRPYHLGESRLELRRERPAVRHVQEIRDVDRLLIPEDLVFDHRLQREHVDQQLAEDEGARGECRDGDPERRIALTRRFTDREPDQRAEAHGPPAERVARDVGDEGP